MSYIDEGPSSIKFWKPWWKYDLEFPFILEAVNRTMLRGVDGVELIIAKNYPI